MNKVKYQTRLNQKGIIRQPLDWKLMIKSFADKETEKIFEREFSRKLPNDIQRIARRKLEVLDAAESLNDLRVPPSNRLEN